MELHINTTLHGNLSELSQNRLKELSDRLDDGNGTSVPKDELIAIGKELIAANIGRLDGENLERLVADMEEGEPVKLYQVQNVFSDYVERALRGKTGGARKRKSRRGTRKSRRGSRKGSRRVKK